jgi:RNA polymerase sigma-70 factor (ECF subfamily)
MMIETAPMEKAELFEQYRPYLFSIAYRMVASVGDAEDLVQEAYLRWQRVTEHVASPKGFLATIVTRLALDFLDSARVRREEYVGPWLPEPLVFPEEPASLAESVSMAFLVLLQSLSPVERAVYLLREVFDYGYDEIARIVGKSEVNCRQLFVRARQNIAERRPRFTASEQESERLTEQFLRTVGTGDLPALVSLLSDDITMWSDGGGKATAARIPIYGADRVARFLIGIRSKAPADYSYRLARVNGQPGIVNYTGGTVTSVIILDIGAGRVQGLYAVVNPEKLRHVR